MFHIKSYQRLTRYSSSWHLFHIKFSWFFTKCSTFWRRRKICFKVLIYVSINKIVFRSYFSLTLRKNGSKTNKYYFFWLSFHSLTLLHIKFKISERRKSTTKNKALHSALLIYIVLALRMDSSSYINQQIRDAMLTYNLKYQ